MTTIRSLFSYLQTYGYTGANPGHSDFVKAPTPPATSKTPDIAPATCRELLDAPDPDTPVGVRDRAILSTFAFCGCRVGEVSRLRVGDLKTSGVTPALFIRGKGKKERLVGVPPEAHERIDAWITLAAIRDDPKAALFPGANTARGNGHDGFRTAPLSIRALKKLFERYARRFGLSGVGIHSMRVTSGTQAHGAGADLVSLQEWYGHADINTTRGYIRAMEKITDSPGFKIHYPKR